MFRKNFLKGMALAAFGGGALVAKASPSSDSDIQLNISKGTIVHSVYFWLKEDISTQEKKEFLEFFEILKKVPGIASYYVGKAASTTKRNVVDNSFSYHWLVTFNNLDDVNTYEKHPDHLAAANKYSKYWEKVEVKDSIF